MGSVTLNLDGVEAWEAGGMVLAPGSHTVKITECKLGTSSGGHPQFEMRFESTDGNGAIKDRLVMAPAAMGKVRAFLEAAGVQVPSGAFQIRDDGLVGRSLLIVVGEEPDREDPSKKWARVRGYSRLSGGDVPIATPQVAAGAAAVDDDIPF